MNTNNYFSFSRLGLVMKRDFVENWKTNLYVFLGFMFAFMASYLSMMVGHDGSDNISLDIYISSYVGSFITIVVFAFLLYASMMMKNMQTKENRFSYLMLPATMLEKFMARALYATVGVFLMIMLSSLLVEAVHWLLVPLFDLPDHLNVCVWPKVWGEIFENLNPFKTMQVIIDGEKVCYNQFFLYLMAYMVAFWWHSLYVLGGNLWYRWSFVKTTFAIVVVSLLLVCIGVNINWEQSDFYWLDNLMKSKSKLITEEMVAGCMSCIFFVFTALNWWLSYKLFTRQQVIKPKFRLL